MITLRGLFASLVAFAVFVPIANAQQPTGTVTGQVLEEGSQRPVQGAQVSIPGTGVGTITNELGRYQIARAPAGTQEIRVRLIGYQQQSRTIEVVAGQSVEASFVLVASAVELNPVVVSAITGREQRRQELGTNVGNIDMAELENNPITKLADVITGRTAGVMLQGVAGTIGTSQKIRIRGSNSISLSNEPLVYVDGVLVSSGTAPAFGVGGQQATRFNDINPEDIETIEILKGPAASALYGTAAANGVLLITTKKGRVGQARWSAYAEKGSIEDRTSYPHNYRSTRIVTPGAPIFTATGAFNSTDYPSCRNDQAARGLCAQDTTFTFNVLRDDRTTPFQIGDRDKYGISVSGGTDVVTYFVSGDLEQEQGVISYNTLDKVSLRANMRAQLRDDLTLSISSGYITSELSLPNNDNSIFSPVLNGLVGSHVFFPNFSDGSVNWRNYGFSFTPAELAEWPTFLGEDRFTIGANTTWQPLVWLSGNFNTGLDYIGSHSFRSLQPNRLPIAQTFTLGHRSSLRRATYVYSLNASGRAQFDLSTDFRSTSTVGGSFQRSQLEDTECFGAGIVEGTRSCGATAFFFDVDEAFSDVRTIGGFFQQELAWRDRLFLAGSIRGDDNSAFGTDFGFVYYPSASASWVVYQEPWFPQLDALSNLRLRSAWGTSGLRPGFRDAITLFAPTLVTINNSDVPAVTLSNTGNVLLKPERSTETEVGFDLGLLDNRVSFDYTYFWKKSRDALIARNLAGSLGVSGSIFENIGSVENSGAEAQFRASVIQTPQIGLDVRLSASTLHNRIVALGEDVNDIVINRGEQRHREGLPPGSFFLTQYTFDDANGDGLLAPSEVTLDAEPTFMGVPQPTNMQSLSLDITLMRYVRVSTLFDRRAGFLQLNTSERFRCTNFQNCPGAHDPNASLEDQAAWIAVAFYGSVAGYVEKADFTKWRELAITFSPWEGLVERVPQIQGASLTLSGRNLKTWTDYSGLDPEINESGASNFNQGEFNTQPPLRYFLARLNFNF